MFVAIEKQLETFDYIYFFNANFQFFNPTDLTEIAPRAWDNGLVAGIHPGILTTKIISPDQHSYERRSQSTAYIPFGSGQHYVCGAFNGGTAAAYLEMCKTLSTNIRTDLENEIIACVDDESHLNAYLANRNFLLCGAAYGFPEAKLKRMPKKYSTMVKIISRQKNSPKYGGERWLRGQTDHKMLNIPGLKAAGRIIAGLLFWWSKPLRQKIRSYCG
ncbi:hypothetical protein AGMMS49965_25690 [Bacteroidia bacterium]|nr:hypothetical protein AGMMS49965_25690 [Bacteroidia bacterium]